MKLVGLWCLVVALVARGCLVKAECCWDSLGYAELKCDPDKARGESIRVMVGLSRYADAESIRSVLSGMVLQ